MGGQGIAGQGMGHDFGQGPQGGTGPWGGGQPSFGTPGGGLSGPADAQGQHLHDPHYHSWRERQNRQFDEDWQAFNRERQKSFDEEFDTWRKSKLGGGSGSSGGAGSASPAQGSAGREGQGSVKDK